MELVKYICDCGAQYSDTGALLACANSNHGKGWATGEWQPMDSAPKDRVGPASYENHGPRILAVNARGYVRIVRWDWHQNGKTGNWKEDDGRVTYGPLTHWQPLPEPPQ